MMLYLTQIIVLLAVTITLVVVFQRWRIPTSLGYLLVGVVLGPHTIGPVIAMPGLEALAEFGVVFLLFTIGLDFSLPQMHALRHQVPVLGTGQVALTTIVAGTVMWLVGLPLTVAFVFGAAYAQSSTTIISSLLSEQGEEHTWHGRRGLAMSVFQDVTAVPFLVIIPVLGVSVGPAILAGTLGLALAKAALALVLVLLVGRWLLRPFFHLIAERRSVEMFTLAVLLVALFAAWVTNSLGLSLAFGGFLAGMVLGKTEFRHQVESSIRPFRDVLLGLFFIGIGMRFNPIQMLPVWHLVMFGALLLVVSKTLIVAALVRRVVTEAGEAWRTGLMLAVGGEFGLALIAIALDSSVLDLRDGQIAIASVIVAMMLGALLIRFNGPIADWLTRTPVPTDATQKLPELAGQAVIIGGYGRMGRTIAVLLQACDVPFVVFDIDPQRVALGRADRHPVWLGDIANPALLSSIQVRKSPLVVIAIDNEDWALAAMTHISRTCPQVPVIVRTRDLEASERLLAAGAAHAHPETIESSLGLGAAALHMLNVASDEIEAKSQAVRDLGYQPVVEAADEPLPRA